MRDLATRLAADGFRVFPLAEGSKVPRAGVSWKTAATDQPAAVWETWPDDTCNVGIATGGGLVVVDVDSYKPGAASAETLRLPETFTVRTGRGGLQYYYRTSGPDVSNSAGKLGPHVDVRGAGGYVVAPGSIVEGRKYEIVAGNPRNPAPLPEHIAQRLSAAPETRATPGDSIGPLDTPEAIDRARARALEAAPAVEGNGGDAHTVAVANSLIDSGVSADTAAEILAEDWNERCSPPWDFEDLLKKCRNALTYRTDLPGRDNFGVSFADVDGPPVAPGTGFAARLFDHYATAAEESTIPPRPWLVDGLLIRECVTMLAAPGSAGKSTLSLQLALALARGGGLGFDVRESSRVLVINNEDSPDEMRRRVSAVHRHFGVDRADTFGRVKYFSNREGKFQIAQRDPRGRISVLPGYQELRDYVRGEGVGCVMFDPLVSIHGAAENNNTEMQQVMDLLTGLAIGCGVSVLLVSHTSKHNAASSESYAGNADAARGASAVKDAARLMLTLFSMSEKDGERYGVDPRTRHRYVRLDDAKMNLTLASPEARWFRKESVALDNASGNRPADVLGVLAPVTLRDASAERGAAALSVLARAVDEPVVSLSRAADLVRADPFFAGVSKHAATALIQDALAAPATVHGRTIRLDRCGAAGGTVRLDFRT